MNDELLKKCKDIFERLLEHGQFFSSAIEFDPFDWKMDGEDLEKEIKTLIDELNNHIQGQ